MKERFWRGMRVMAPLAVILPGWSLSEIPDFFWSAEFKSFAVQVLTQLVAGVADAVIGVATLSAFGLV